MTTNSIFVDFLFRFSHWQCQRPSSMLNYANAMQTAFHNQRQTERRFSQVPCYIAIFTVPIVYVSESNIVIVCAHIYTQHYLIPSIIVIFYIIHCND